MAIQSIEGREPPPAVTAPPVEAMVDDESAVIVLRDVVKEFNGNRAVNGMTLSIPAGGLVGLIGPSGCGKTTAVRLALGIYEPTEGHCEIFGLPSGRLPIAYRERLGYLPQQFVLYPTLTVDENLNFAAATYGLGPLRRRQVKREVLELAGLTEHRRTLAGKISGGMQRRLALAATLLHQPEVIFLDEPTAGIDPILREHLWAEFRRLQQQGRTQLITTQYVGEAEYCDTVVLMDDGAIVAQGTPEELRRLAAGGDTIDIKFTSGAPEMAQQLYDLPGVLELRESRRGEIRLVCEEAATLMPDITTLAQQQGAEIEAIQERRLSFNEVFVALLQQRGHAATEAIDE